MAGSIVHLKAFLGSFGLVIRRGAFTSIVISRNKLLFSVDAVGAMDSATVEDGTALSSIAHVEVVATL
jgi:hypothetical protein